MPTAGHPSGLLQEAMEQLYAGAPEDFLGVRKRLVTAAKAAGDGAAAQDIGALRKPTLAAWAVNLTMRSRADLVRQLAEVGQQLRTAQGALDMPRLQALRPERDAAIDAVVAGCVDTAEAAGRPLSPSLRDTLAATVVAALASEEATTAVASGTLTRALSYSGFGEVDLHEAVARTSSGAILTVLDSAPSPPGQDGDASVRDPSADAAADDPAATADPAADLAAAEAALTEAETALATAREDVTAARDRGTVARARIEELETELSRVRAEDEESLEGLSDAVRSRRSAEAARRVAADEVAALRRASR